MDESEHSKSNNSTPRAEKQQKPLVFVSDACIMTLYKRAPRRFKETLSATGVEVGSEPKRNRCPTRPEYGGSLVNQLGAIWMTHLELVEYVQQRTGEHVPPDMTWEDIVALLWWSDDR